MENVCLGLHVLHLHHQNSKRQREPTRLRTCSGNNTGAAAEANLVTKQDTQLRLFPVNPLNPENQISWMIQRQRDA